jgi:HEPN domain-containing protein
MKKATREWVRKAEEDHQVVGRLAGADKPIHDAICFHCQQAVEKYLKALLEELGQFIPKTHDLNKLSGLLIPTYPGLKAFRRAYPVLTRYAVDTRYPGRTATKRQAISAARWADRVREACRTLLTIKPPKSKP